MNSYDAINQALRNIAGVDNVFSLDHKEEGFGDYATNIAFSLSKKEGISPKDYAEKTVPQLQEVLSEVVEKIEVASPGFINFFLKDDVVRKENERDKLKLVTKYTGKYILVEHSSPNLFKPFSVGHLMNNIIGEFVARAARVGGAQLRTMSFPSDVSLGIAKALFIIGKDIQAGKINFEYFENSSETETVAYLGEAYVRGIKECEEDEENLKEVKSILDKMYKRLPEDTALHDIIAITRRINENYFKNTLKSLSSNIDDFIYESNAGEVGQWIVEANTGEEKVFTRSEGAIIYTPDEERKDINTSVFINSQGYPTYEAKDLGLIQIKFEQLENFKPDLSLFITDQEQIQHFKVVFDAASKIDSKWKERISKSIHIPHGRMLFKGEKISSRLGGVPLALQVINTVCEEVRVRAGEKIAHLDEDERKKLEREIALSALRIAVLRSKPGVNINFDPETSLSFEGDSGPYLLYTHARCFSLLEKGKEKNYEPEFSQIKTTRLEHTLILFENVLHDSIETLSPQKLVTYLFNLAQEFNSFYATTHIISEDVHTTKHNLAIVQRAKFVLKEGLYVLGIVAPNRM